MCAIDLSKAFDRVNHYALFSKLMKRFVPNELLIILNVGSQIAAHASNGMTTGPTFFTLDFGVRQGSVLSPFLFAL